MDFVCPTFISLGKAFDVIINKIIKVFIFLNLAKLEKFKKLTISRFSKQVYY